MQGAVLAVETIAEDSDSVANFPVLDGAEVFLPLSCNVLTLKQHPLQDFPHQLHGFGDLLKEGEGLNAIHTGVANRHSGNPGHPAINHGHKKAPAVVLALCV